MRAWNERHAFRRTASSPSYPAVQPAPYVSGAAESVDDLPLPPLREGGFWSLSLYEATPEGGFYFVENPLKRYAIGDRTPGLVRDAGGSISLRIGAGDPGDAARANWLPAPAGPFALVMRTYLPGPKLLDGRFRLPPVRPA